ncbi:MAG: YceI family protein [Bryobacteraceae bacterium]
MKLHCLLPSLALAFGAMPVQAERIDVAVEPGAAKIEWALAGNIHTVHGSFQLEKGELWFDPETHQAGGLLVVDATTGDSGNGARDSRMHKNVLESARYPKITFVPDRIEGAVSVQGASESRLHGQFTIHGATHEMVMKVTSRIEGGDIDATLDFPVPYVKWGMKNPGNFLLRVNDTVDLSIHVAAHVRTRIPPSSGGH